MGYLVECKLRKVFLVYMSRGLSFWLDGLEFELVIWVRGEMGWIVIYLKS